jgi:hypothetical protein
MEALLRLIDAHLQASSSALVIMEDYNSEPGDKWLGRCAHRLIVHAGHVYHALVPENAGQTAMQEAAIRESRTWTHVGVLTERRGMTPGSLPAVFTDSDLDDVVANISLVFVGAYDTDGWLFWQPPCRQE